MAVVVPLKSLDDTYDDEVFEETSPVMKTPTPAPLHVPTPPPSTRSKLYNVIQSLFLNGIQMILAGIYIGIGGMLYITARRYVHSHELGSLLFSLGLLLVCFLQGQLYTGAIGRVIREKPHRCVSIMKLLPMLVFNVGGACAIGFFMSGFVGSHFEEQYKYINEDYYETSLKSVFCGSCVWHAVEHFAYRRPLSWAKIPFFVTLFVYAGFEHCIANSFYWSFYDVWSWKAAINVGVCVVGNSIGSLF